MEGKVMYMSSRSVRAVVEWRWIKGKKAQEILPILLLLGMISGFAVFGFMRLQELGENRSDPFYGSLGQREIHLMTLKSLVETEMSTMDIIATQSIRDAVSDKAGRMYITDPGCINPSGIPLANHPYNECFSESDLSDSSERLKESFSRAMYDRMISSSISLPFNHDIFFVQDGNHLVAKGYSRGTVNYPIDASEFQDGEVSASARSTRSHAIDMSNECNYIGDLSRAVDITGRNSDDFECSGRACTGPCPDELQPEPVPYMNQCNIHECADGFCNIDYENICQQGCGFKSSQMAFLFFGEYFDELGSPNTGSISSLMEEMRGDVLESGDIEEERKDIFDDVETTTSRVTIPGDSTSTLEVADSIDDEHYDLIEEVLDEGLVRLQITHEYDKFERIPECSSETSELGYCINQHYVLAITGNEDYVVIHDPYTAEREYKTGINVVVSRDYIMDHWTGEYSIVRGEA